MTAKAQIFFPALTGLRYDGITLASGTVTFKEPGLETLRAIYIDRNKSSEKANPVTLDANGQAEIFLAGVYDVVVKNAAGVTKATWDGYEGASVENIDLAAAEGSLAGIEAALKPVRVDTSAGNVVKALPTTAYHASYVKSTADANIVTFSTTGGESIAEPDIELTTQNSAVTFEKTDGIWSRV